MSALLLLLACAHRPAATPALDGGWSNDQMGIFIGIEGAESTPEVWVVRSGSEAAWVALEPTRLPEGAVSFRLPEDAGPSVTFSLSPAEGDSASLVLAYETGREEVVSMSRAAPRSREDLEGLIASLAQAKLEGMTAAHVRGLRTAEMAYHAAFDAYLPMPVWPRPVAELTPEPVPWPEGSDYDILGWSPAEAVRGTFQIEVAVDGSDFTVHGWQDLDGDGVPARWTATRTDGPALVSDPGVR